MVPVGQSAGLLLQHVHLLLPRAQIHFPKYWKVAVLSPQGPVHVACVVFVSHGRGTSIHWHVLGLNTVFAGQSAAVFVQQSHLLFTHIHFPNGWKVTVSIPQTLPRQVSFVVRELHGGGSSMHRQVLGSKSVPAGQSAAVAVQQSHFPSTHTHLLAGELDEVIGHTESTQASRVVWSLHRGCTSSQEQVSGL